jgi:hypothetical protein
MADNVGYTPGTGATVAADEIGGILYQRIKPVFGDDGTATDVSATNPMPMVVPAGELIEAIEALRMGLHSLIRSMGQTMPDNAGRMRVLVDSITGSLTLATITTVGTVSTVTNQTQVGGLPALEMVPALMRTAAETLRRNITVS